MTPNVVEEEEVDNVHANRNDHEQLGVSNYKKWSNSKQKFKSY